MRFTPSNINNLEPNEVFVFGSNEAGIHGAGAALLARIKFGAVIGEGFGLYGQSFAIPTKDEKIKTLPIHNISQYVQAFLIFASKRRDLTFYVTRIGTGLALYTDKDIAPLFKKGIGLDNIVLPKEFYNIINQECK